MDGYVTVNVEFNGLFKKTLKGQITGCSMSLVISKEHFEHILSSQEKMIMMVYVLSLSLRHIMPPNLQITR